jgi:hypothetical protein
MDVQACGKCEHCMSDNLWWPYNPHCRYFIKSTDCISGNKNYHRCVDMRKSEFFCGEDARHFKSKVPLWRKVIMRLGKL